MERKTIYTIFISLGAIFLLLGGYAVITGTPLLSVFGSSTLSLDKVTLKSNFAQLNGEAWMLTFRAGGLGQSYYGSFDADEVEDDEKTATNDFSIDVEYEDQICNYDLAKSGSSKPIYNDLKMKTFFCVTQGGLSDEVDKISGFVLASGIDSPFSHPTSPCWIVYSPTQSTVGFFGSPDLESEYTITIDVDGDEVSKTINSLSSSSQGMIGDYAYAVWQGNLVSGKSCPDKDPYIGYYYNGKWRIGDSEDYDDYKGYLSDVITTNRDVREIAVSNIRSAAAKARSGGSFGSIADSTSLNSASVKVTLDDAVQFPMTTLYIKADKLGIYTPASEIKLYDPNSECFKTGDQGSIEVGLENTGDERWAGRLYAECESPFASSRSLDVSLSPGEKETRFLTITADASSHINGQCTVYAEGVGSSDSVKLRTCVDPQVTCSAGTEFCSTNGDLAAIKRCSSDGATSSVKKTCTQGEFCEDAECKDGDDNDDDGQGFFGGLFKGIGDFFGNLFNGFFDFFTILKLAIVAIFSIVAVFVSSDLLKQIESLKEIKTARWIIAVVIGVGMAFLLYTFIYSFWFWILLIGSIAYFMYGKPIVKALRITGR